MTPAAIRREESAAGGRYVLPLPQGEAALEYRRLGPDLVSADHTFTPPEARGGGVASALVARLVADARAEGFRIAPACPYVAVWARRHPKEQEVFASQAPDLDT